MINTEYYNMSHKPQDLKTYFLREPLSIVRVKADIPNVPNIQLINPPDDQLKKVQAQYDDKLNIIKGFECFGTYIEGIFFKTVFVSPLLVETISLAENEYGNHYQLIAVEPGNLCDPDLDDDNHSQYNRTRKCKNCIVFWAIRTQWKTVLNLKWTYFTGCIHAFFTE